MLSSKNLNIQHNSAKIPNKLIESVDWGSRNHVECKPDPNLPGVQENCPYCTLAWTNDDVSFASVRNIELQLLKTSVEDLMRKSSPIPFKTRTSWLSLQRSCSDMRKAVAHIKAGTIPSAKECRKNFLPIPFGCRRPGKNRGFPRSPRPLHCPPYSRYV